MKPTEGAIFTNNSSEISLQIYKSAITEFQNRSVEVIIIERSCHKQKKQANSKYLVIAIEDQVNFNKK